MSPRAAVLIVFVVFAGTVNASNGLDQYLARVSGLQAVALIRSGDPDGVQRLMHAANRGDVIAQFNLGVAYSNGYVSGGEDAVRAARWYSRAAARGYARAAFNLGALYANGRLQDSDPPSEAKRWMKVAANAGHNGAMQWLFRQSRPSR